MSTTKWLAGAIIALFVVISLVVIFQNTRVGDVQEDPFWDAEPITEDLTQNRNVNAVEQVYVFVDDGVVSPVNIYVDGGKKVIMYFNSDVGVLEVPVFDVTVQPRGQAIFTPTHSGQFRFFVRGLTDENAGGTLIVRQV